MLDLEGVLIAKAIPGPGRDIAVRPYAHRFTKEIPPLFDRAYLNTCVLKDRDWT